MNWLFSFAVVYLTIATWVLVLFECLLRSAHGRVVITDLKTGRKLEGAKARLVVAALAFLWPLSLVAVLIQMGRE